jgi:hypothetical protein
MRACAYALQVLLPQLMLLTATRAEDDACGTYSGDCMYPPSVIGDKVRSLAVPCGIRFVGSSTMYVGQTERGGLRESGIEQQAHYFSCRLQQQQRGGGRKIIVVAV